MKDDSKDKVAGPTVADDGVFTRRGFVAGAAGFGVVAALGPGRAFARRDIDFDLLTRSDRNLMKSAGFVEGDWHDWDEIKAWAKTIAPKLIHG